MLTSIKLEPGGSCFRQVSVLVCRQHYLCICTLDTVALQAVQSECDTIEDFMRRTVFVKGSGKLPIRWQRLF